MADSKTDRSKPTPPSIVTRADDPRAALGAFIAQELENWNFHVYADRSDALRVSTGFGVVLTVTIEKAASMRQHNNETSSTRPQTLSDKQWAALLRWPVALALLPGQIVKFWRNEP